MSESIEQFRAQIREAAKRGRVLRVRGGGSKGFYGRTAAGEVLEVGAHRGIVSYEPSELVVTARAGTFLDELEAALAERGQMLGFEPPHFGPDASVGGCVAAGLSGPRRASAGAVRDFVLGVKMLDGRGEVLHFGGEVMKNVAGYDVSRLMAGSLGTLGVLLEVSLKVLPLPAAEASLRFELGEGEAISRLNEWGGQPLPISASFWCNGQLQLRLSGARAAVAAARSALGGELLPDDEARTLWAELREQQHALFAAPLPLWRFSLPSASSPLRLAGRQAIEWGGAQRWLASDAPAEALRRRAAELGGHVTLFRGGEHGGEVFHPLPAPLMTLHRRLKASFDPAGVFSTGRLYAGL